jgi:hypothetical protein
MQIRSLGGNIVLLPNAEPGTRYGTAAAAPAAAMLWRKKRLRDNRLFMVDSLPVGLAARPF